MITIDQKIAELIENNLNIDGWPWGNLLLCVIALVLTIVLCGAIGLEREKRGRNAGLRTHLLVGVGSCVIMIISIYGFPTAFAEKRDVARLAAQVVAGVGFLGAGVIMHRNNGARGLTTAGTIWITMAIGIACGSFNYILAIIGTIIILAVLISFRRLETKINGRKPMITIVDLPTKPILNNVLKVAKEFNCEINFLSTELQTEGKEEFVEVIFTAKFDDKGSRLNEFMSRLEEEICPKSIQLLNHK